MTFTEREQKLLEFAKFHHGTQKRKYTKEPYYVHLVGLAAPQLCSDNTVLAAAWSLPAPF